MSDLILHHYWPSPVAHKVRSVLGIKNLDWRSVEIPRIPPKPDVVALTGGYRRTPVLQVGADIYCDSLCIINELDRRFPAQAGKGDSSPAAAPIAQYGFTRWTDGEILTHVIRVVLGSQIDTLDPDFLADRARLYFGRDWTKELIANGVEHSKAQICAAFQIMETNLADSAFIHGDDASTADAYFYYLLWFIRGRFAGGADLISPFEKVSAWEQRMEAIGHGRDKELSSTEAITIARDATPEAASINLKGARKVQIVPDVDGGDPPVTGLLVEQNHQEIIIARSVGNPETDGNGLMDGGDTVHVHFPTTGYVVNG